VTASGSRRFDPSRLQRLNNPERLRDIPPDLIWSRLAMPPLKEATFVEVGAGTGFFSRQFLDYTGGGRVFACDVSPVMVDWMRENVTEEYPDVIPMLMEDNLIPLEDSSADLVYSINLHHELDDPAAMLREARRLLKDSGKLFIADWRREPMQRGPRLEIRYETEEVRDQLAKSGFSVMETFEGLPMQFLIVARR
jgi:SAM-dependent methyltransferase